jgi:FMN reductase (NADPH)
MLSEIATHRSIRKYDNRNISENILKEILEAGSRASTIGNMQVYSIIVTQDPIIKEKLWEAHFKQDMIKQAPVVITFCADIHRFGEWCLQRNAEPGYDNFLWFVFGATDALLASQNVTLEAERHGLGICYLGTTNYMARQIIEILNLPKGVVPVTTVVMGYPAENPGLTDRLPLEAVVHFDTYKEFTPERINSVYRERDNCEETIKLLNINKKETLAQIFTENRYTKKDNLTFSKEYLDILREQGFMNNDPQ